MSVSAETEKCVAATHPCLAGHFPNDPIVPGVLILDEVRTVIAQTAADARINCVRLVKFIAPLKPQVQFRITLQWMNEVEVRFSCAAGNQIIAHGLIQLSRCN